MTVIVLLAAAVLLIFALTDAAHRCAIRHGGYAL